MKTEETSTHFALIFVSLELSIPLTVLSIIINRTVPFTLYILRPPASVLWPLIRV
jgi:hypothetical protein